jgi:hypothetical protein
MNFKEIKEKLEKHNINPNDLIALKENVWGFKYRFENEAEKTEKNEAIYNKLKDIKSDEEWIEEFKKTIGIGESELIQIPTSSVEEIKYVVNFKSHNVFIQINGWVSSYDTGSEHYQTDWDKIDEVVPTEVTTIIYVKKQ